MNGKAVACVFLIILLFVTGVNAFADEIKVGGGGAAISTVFNPVRPHFEKATGLYLINMQTSPKDGLIDLLNGKIDAAVAAVSLESMIEAVKKDGIKVDILSLQKTVIGINKTVVLVHKSNPVNRLSKVQIKGIFTGRITNWKEVGGNDRDIIVVWGKKTPGQNSLFQKVILDGTPIMKDTLEAFDYGSIYQIIESNPDAIGIDPLGFATSNVKPIEMTQDMSTPIIIVTKSNPSPDVQKLINYIKGEGQKYIIK